MWDVGARVSLDVNVENMSGIWPCETAACPLLLLFTFKWYTCEQGKVHSFSPPL